ncbi:glutathione S-transferase [Armillaria luteobubalina]|uniref:Glutathione S-transferase n=1 Tax=Armillaria luteobubalina TaxID=153913 RepID=A0AA39PBJ1_9AGAR|nr:glutathione S-transferase [Armillaria luteobubalina]KAK0497611.1 glutathione S-transferase [Armillaria luteobubalina]
MPTTIVFYDIPSKLSINAWSPNTWKVRYALNYKGIPYRTEWVEYPDIEGLYKTFGIPASATKKDRVTPYYTLPLLRDLSTGAIISESAAIVEYLEATYPNTPRLIPPGTRALHAAFIAAFESQMRAISPFTIPSVNAILSPRSEAFFRKTREESSGVTIEDMILHGEHRTSQLVLVKDALGKVDKWMTKEQTFVMGETPTFADFTVSAWIFYLRICLGEDSHEWKELSTWHNGRWGKLVKSFEKYDAVL